MITVGFCVDRAYLLPMLVTLVSIADTHELCLRRTISLRVLSPDISRSEALTVEDIVRRLGFQGVAFRCLLPPPNIEIVNGPYISTTTYLRFAFDDSFVSDPFLLYLDADVMICGEMMTPFNQLGSHAIGAVVDEINHTVGTSPALPGFIKKYPIYHGRPYFNAGVLWLRTAALRSTNEGCLSALRARKHIHFNDQDALNMWLLTSEVGVAVPALFNRFDLDRLLQESDWVKRVALPLPPDTGTHAVHFIGKIKPWHRRCPGVPSVRLYGRALRNTRIQVARVRGGSLEIF